MLKQSQIKQVFIYIFLMLIVGALFLVGYKAFDSLMQKNCEAEKISFQKTFFGLVNRFSLYGALNRESLHLPCDFYMLCLADASKLGNTAYDGGNKYIDDAVQSGSANIFLLTFENKTIDAVGTSRKIQIYNPEKTLCIKKLSGVVKIEFAGRSNTTRIRPFS